MKRQKDRIVQDSKSKYTLLLRVGKEGLEKSRDVKSLLQVKAFEML